MKSSLCSGALLCVAVAACGHAKDDVPPLPPTTIALGDCVETSATLFVSGPRPVAPGDDVDPADGGGSGTHAGDDATGGFGFSGSGSGSETGLGRIGHVSWSGSGYGIGGARRSSAVPTISSGQPVANGDLDKAIIRRFIRRNLPKLQYCYEKQLLVNPKLSGTVMAQFFIGPDGFVTSASAAGVDPEVASCVADVIKSIEFPKPKGGGGVQVNYPFTFRFAGQTGPIAAAPKLPPEAGSAAEPPPPAAPPPVEPKRPALDNPLVAIEGAMKECLAKQPKAYGAFVVDLGFNPKGATEATVVGVDGATAACIATAAHALARPTTKSPTMRCGVSFGDMPIADVPTIQITDKDIAFDHKVVDHPKAVVLDTSDSPHIAALGEALDAWAKPLAPTASAVPVRGPGLIEPIDATPMRVVSRVIETTLENEADFVLAAQANTAWRPLRSVHVPVAPVAVGTGRAWSFIPNGKAKGTAETVVMSVLVTQNQIWLGVSRIDEFQEIPGRDWDKLEAMLKEHKASAFFADRIDVEIAGEDAVTYGDIVKVIDVAAKVGFTGWHVVPPARITARPTL